jgi:hypothetical protein
MKMKHVTARELVAELSANPAWVVRREAKRREFAGRSAVCADDQLSLVNELRGCGYAVESVWDLVNNAPHEVVERRFVGSYQRAYPVLVRHLQIRHVARVREGIIRALTVRDGGTAVERALLNEFEVEADPELLWVLANALRVAMPYARRRKRPEIGQD